MTRQAGSDSTVTVELSSRAYEALVGLKDDDEDLDGFVLRLATAARASGFFGQMRRGREQSNR
jgi:hypothetical protein